MIIILVADLSGLIVMWLLFLCYFADHH